MPVQGNIYKSHIRNNLGIRELPQYGEILLNTQTKFSAQHSTRLSFLFTPMPEAQKHCNRTEKMQWKKEFPKEFRILFTQDTMHRHLQLYSKPCLLTLCNTTQVLRASGRGRILLVHSFE